MNLKPTPSDSQIPEGNPSSADPSSEWNDHEHTSEHVQLEAEKLVQLVGSPELAKHAINVVEQRLGDAQAKTVEPATSGTLDRNEFFLKALASFETAIATPVVAGELSEWVTNALRICETVGELLQDELPRLHAELYARILSEDLDLSSQVERLRATDSQLALVEYNAVTAGLKQLLGLSQSVKQDEAKLSSVTEKVTKQAMDFIVAARTQETVIKTWFGEAFSRDLGSGD